jgi:hypothetical protein
MTKNEAGGEEDIVLEDLPKIEEGQEDKTDYKALAIKNHGIAQRYKTKLDKQKESKGSEGGEGEGGNKGGKGGEGTGVLDKLDRAVLRVEKITAPDEIKLVESYMKETGKDIEAVLASKYFQAELKEMRDLAATEDATPTGEKRSGVLTRDTVEYWIAAGKLPEDPVLRQKVVNAKIAKEKNVSQFSSNPLQ